MMPWKRFVSGYSPVHVGWSHLVYKEGQCVVGQPDVTSCVARTVQWDGVRRAEADSQLNRARRHGAFGASEMKRARLPGLEHAYCTAGVGEPLLHRSVPDWTVGRCCRGHHSVNEP